METQYVDRIRSFAELADSIACSGHKIYMLLDKEQTEEMRGLGFYEIHTSEEMDSEQMATTVARWFDAADSLRFVNAVMSTPGHEPEKYANVIAQFEIEFEGDEEEDD